MVKKISTLISGLSAIGLTALFISAPALAETRPDVLERIRPVGKVNIVGQPAAPAAAAPAPAPEAAPAPAAEAAPAEAPAAAASGGTIDGEAIYKTACFACHDGQLPMAPKLGDKEKWAPRIAKGKEALYQSAFNGVAGTPMPPRGNCPSCSDDDLKAAVDFMVSKSE